MTTPDFQPSAVEQSITFWDERHRSLAGSHGGGDPSYDAMGNEAFHALRIGRLLDLLGTMAEPAAPLRILDAGCGTGWLTRALASFGHQVDGIDFAPTAVDMCQGQARSDGRDGYALSSLDAWAPAYLYDAVVSVDVLPHIKEDLVWAASVVSLACLVRSGGSLLLVDHDLAEDQHCGPHQKSRARRRYVELLAPEGLTYRRFAPYEFRNDRAGFHVFDRTARC